MMKRLFISLVLILFVLMGMTEVVHASAGITIDGKFDDWKNQPVEKWTTDKFTYHDVGFVADDQYVYVYVSMAPKNPGNYKVMQPSGYQISINNHTYDLTLHLYDKLWSLQPGEGGRFSADVVNTDLKLSEITGLKMYFFTGLNAVLYVVPCNPSCDMIYQKF